MPLSHVRLRPAVIALATLGLSFGLTACGSSDGGSATAEDGAATDSSAGTSADPDEGPADTPEPETPDTEEPDDKTPALDHPAALAAGFDGTVAIRCTYTYDDDELRQLQTMSLGADIPPEATVYLDRGVVYWDVPQPDGRVSHVLGRDGAVYTWKVPGDGTGVEGTDESPDSLAVLEDRMTRNASDCVAYDGPSSIFEVPGDITFIAPGI